MESDQLIEPIKTKGAELAISGIVDLSELAVSWGGMPRIVFESVQNILL